MPFGDDRYRPPLPPGQSAGENRKPANLGSGRRALVVTAAAVGGAAISLLMLPGVGRAEDVLVQSAAILAAGTLCGIVVCLCCRKNSGKKQPFTEQNDA